MTPFKTILQSELNRLEHIITQNDSYSPRLTRYARKNGILLETQRPSWGWLSMARVVQFLL